MYFYRAKYCVKMYIWYVLLLLLAHVLHGATYTEHEIHLRCTDIYANIEKIELKIIYNFVGFRSHKNMRQ